MQMAYEASPKYFFGRKSTLLGYRQKRSLLLTATTSLALLLGSAFPAHSMTAQDAHNKPDVIAFEASARAAANHCGDKSFGDDFVRHSKRYVKALYPAGAEQQIAKVPVSCDVVAINRADCPLLICTES